MKEVKAIFRTFKLDEVITALYEIEGLPGFTVSEVKSFARKTRDRILFKPMLRTKLEVTIHDHMLEEVLTVIKESAFTGNPGDGKIFVYEVDDVLKIRTNERGKQAI